jgi:hypothetical protein
VFDGQIIDGRHRAQACEEIGIEPAVREYDGEESGLVGFVVSLNLHRRHLDDDQRRMVGAKIVTMTQGRPSETSQIANISREQAAELVNADVPGIDRARKVVKHGAPELVAAVERGEVSVSAAASVAEAPKERQVEIVARGRDEILAAAKQIRIEHAERRRAELAALKSERPPLPDGRFETIVIDPPWEMQKIERDVRPNQVAFDYPTMNEAELAAFGVPAMASDDCHLFCWTTHKHLPMALRLLESWGFRYVCTMVWRKPGGFQPIGLPQYNCEFALYARRGAPQFIDTRAFPACFEAPRREHMIACRVRRAGYADRYPFEFTIRSHRDTGAKTELEKLVDGWGDWMFYGHEDGLASFSRWWLIDLHSWRAALIRDSASRRVGRDSGLVWHQKSNGDGTHFVSFDLRSFPSEPPILVGSSHPIPSRMAA